MYAIKSLENLSVLFVRFPIQRVTSVDIEIQRSNFCRLLITNITKKRETEHSPENSPWIGKTSTCCAEC